MGLDLSRFLEPISDASPCGPDLDMEGDGDYFNYVLPAESRLPDKYLDPVTGKVQFDRSVFDLDKEVETICGFLERSRDLRLLVLMAQFHAAALRLDGFVACIKAMRDLLERFWDDVHPTPYDGDYMLRRASIEALDDLSKVVMPIAFAPLARDKQSGPISYRTYQIAAHPDLKRSSEEPLPLPRVLDGFRSETGREELKTSVELARDGAAALGAIRSMFINRELFEFAPDFGRTIGALEDIVAMARKEVPDLLGETDVATSAAEGEASGDQVTDTDVSFAAPDIPLPAPATVGAVANHAQAAALIVEIERYFLENEPSSPALVLVHQARKLFGRPLIEVLEALVPSRIDNLRISIDPSNGFALAIDRIRQLSTSVSVNGHDAGAGEPVKRIERRDEALGAMQQVERFLSASEPSSPVPLLFSKARAMMGKDFAGVLRDMLVGSDSKPV